MLDDKIHTLPYPDMQAVIVLAQRKLPAEHPKKLSPFRKLLPCTHSAIHPIHAFETHVKTANRNRGQDVPENWYKFPGFIFI